MIDARIPLTTDERGKCMYCDGDAPPESCVCDLCGSTIQLQETATALEIERGNVAELKDLLRILAHAYKGVPVPGSATVDPWPMIEQLLGEE